MYDLLSKSYLRKEVRQHAATNYGEYPGGNGLSYWGCTPAPIPGWGIIPNRSVARFQKIADLGQELFFLRGFRRGRSGRRFLDQNVHAFNHQENAERDDQKVQGHGQKLGRTR